MIVENNVQEYWIRIEDRNNVDHVQEFIMNLEDSFYGDIPVTIFCKNENAIKKLSHNYDLNEEAQGILEEEFGGDDVKFINEKYKRVFYEPEPTPLERISISIEKIEETLKSLLYIIREEKYK